MLSVNSDIMLHFCLLTLFLLTSFTPSLCRAQAVSTANVCNYVPPTISLIVGRLDLTVLTLNPPVKMEIPEKNRVYVIESNICLTSDGGFSCPVVCQPDFCWLTLQIPNVKGVNFIKVYSGTEPNLHVSGFYRKTTAFGPEKHFQELESVVTCTDKEKAFLKWSLLSPENKIACDLNGVHQTHLTTYSGENSSITVELAVPQNAKHFDAAVCKVKVGKNWAYKEQFVFWQDFAEFVQGADVPDNLYVAENGPSTKLTWSISTSENVSSKFFGCVDQNKSLCSGITTEGEPGKCDVQQVENGFKLSITPPVSNHNPAAVYCYVGRKVQAKTVNVFDPNWENKRLITFIWHRMNGRKISLNDKGTHFLWLNELKPEAVSCHTDDWGTQEICEIKPGSFEIHWIVRNKTYPEVIKTLRTKEPMIIKGTLVNCFDKAIVFSIRDPEYDLQQTFSLHKHGQTLSPEAMTRRFLEEALAGDCSSSAVNPYE